MEIHHHFFQQFFNNPTNKFDQTSLPSNNNTITSASSAAAVPALPTSAAVAQLQLFEMLAKPGLLSVMFPPASVNDNNNNNNAADTKPGKKNKQKQRKLVGKKKCKTNCCSHLLSLGLSNKKNFWCFLTWFFNQENFIQKLPVFLFKFVNFSSWNRATASHPWNMPFQQQQQQQQPQG